MRAAAAVDRRAGHGFRGVRAGEASHPGPPHKQRERVQRDLLATRVGQQHAARCSAGVSRFQQWLGNNSYPPLEQLVQRSIRDLDAALARCGQVLYDAGRVHYNFLDPLLGVQNRWRHLRRELVLSWGVNRSWEAGEPCDARNPLPSAGLHAMLTVCADWCWDWVLGLIWLGFHALLRPGEFVALLRGDLIFPQQLGDAVGMSGVVRIRDPKTKKRTDEVQSVLIEEAALFEFLGAAFGDLPRDAPLFQWKEGAFISRLKYVIAEAGLADAAESGFTAGCLRAGGATHDWRAAQNFHRVRMRGRWVSDRSLEHYVQEAQAAWLV